MDRTQTPGQRQQAAAETREAVKAAALRLFEAEGMGAPLRRICAAAGHSTGAFFEHWPTKDALIEELTKTEPTIRAIRIADAVSEITLVAKHHPAGREILAGLHQAATASIE